MSEEMKKPTRREVLGAAACGAGILGLGCAVGAGVYSVYARRKKSTKPSSDDLARYTKVDPALFLYEELSQSKISTGLKESRGITVDESGNLFVIGDEALHVFAPGQKEPKRTTLSGKPYCLAVASSGKLYLGMTRHVEVLGANGKTESQWTGHLSKALLTSIVVHEDNVLVADAGNRVVLRYNLDGKLLGEIGRRDPDRKVPGFVVPGPHFDLAMGSDGLLRVANPGRHRIEMYTLDGDLEGEPWGQYGMEIDRFCGCCNPVNFVIAPNGNFITVEKGITRVKVYDSLGRFQGVVAGPEQLGRQDAIGLDVAVDSQGKIFVMDPFTAEVRVFADKKTT